MWKMELSAHNKPEGKTHLKYCHGSRVLELTRMDNEAGPKNQKYKQGFTELTAQAVGQRQHQQTAITPTSPDS